MKKTTFVDQQQDCSNRYRRNFPGNSTSENDFECFANTGMNAPVAMVPNAVRFNFFETETLPIKTLA